MASKRILPSSAPLWRCCCSRAPAPSTPLSRSTAAPIQSFSTSTSTSASAPAPSRRRGKSSSSKQSALNDLLGLYHRSRGFPNLSDPSKARAYIQCVLTDKRHRSAPRDVKHVVESYSTEGAATGASIRQRADLQAALDARYNAEMHLPPEDQAKVDAYEGKNRRKRGRDGGIAEDVALSNADGERAGGADALARFRASVDDKTYNARRDRIRDALHGTLARRHLGASLVEETYAVNSLGSWESWTSLTTPSGSKPAAK